MANFLISPKDIYSADDANGNPLVGGQLFTYIAGSNTPAATYTDATGGVENLNPIILDARGEARVWLSDELVYKYVLKESVADGGVEIRTTDNIQANNGGGGAGLSFVSHDDSTTVSLSGLGTLPSPLIAELTPATVTDIANKLDKVQAGAQSVVSEVTFDDNLNTKGLLNVYHDNSTIDLGTISFTEGGGALGNDLLQMLSTDDVKILSIYEATIQSATAGVNFISGTGDYKFDSVPDGAPTDAYGQDSNGELVKFDPVLPSDLDNKLDKVQAGAQSVVSEVELKQGLDITAGLSTGLHIKLPSASGYIGNGTNPADGTRLVFDTKFSVRDTFSNNIYSSTNDWNYYANGGSHIFNDNTFTTLQVRRDSFIANCTNYEFQNVPDGTIVDTYGRDVSGKMVKSAAVDTSIWNNSAQCGVVSGFAISQTANQVTIPVGQSQCVDRNSIAKQKDPVPFILENDVEFSIDVDYFPGMITSIYLVVGTTYGVAGRKFDILQTASFDNKARYEGKVFLGNAVTNGVDTIFTVTAVPVLGYGIAATFDDQYAYIGILRRDVQFSMRSSGLGIDRQAGTLFNLYINYINDHYDPNNMDIPLINDGSMVLVKTTPVNLTESSSLEVDMLQYWDGNALANVSNNDWTIQRFFLGGNGQAFVQYGEVVYNLFAQAEQALTSGDDAFTPNPVLKLRNNAHYMGAAIVKQGDTNFNNSVFKPSLAPFGEGISGISSSSTGDLQQAYNNSSLPQILTSLAFTLQSGTGDDADVVLQINNNAGGGVFSVAGNGNILAAGAGTYSGTQTFEVDAVFDAGATFGGLVEAPQIEVQDAGGQNALTLIQSNLTNGLQLIMRGDDNLAITGQRFDQSRRFLLQSDPASDGSNMTLRLYDSSGSSFKKAFHADYNSDLLITELSLSVATQILQGTVSNTGEGIICESLKVEADATIEGEIRGQSGRSYIDRLDSLDASKTKQHSMSQFEDNFRLERADVTTGANAINLLLFAKDSVTAEFAGGIAPKSFTTTEKNLLSVPESTQVYDSTLKKMCFYNGTAWETITSS